MFIGIVADDLTGAADSVAPFAQRGYTAGVVLGVDSWTKELERKWDALAFNTELRDHEDVKPAAIKVRIRRAVRRLIARAPEVYFKKIDSTLRGHLRPELDVMMHELPGRIALICPASPSHRRTVENGVLSVNGMPLAQTEFALGSAQPERFATVRSAFDMANEPTAVEMGLTILHEGVAAVEAALDRHTANGICTVFCDAMTPEDLHTLAEVTLRRPDRYLPVGSAGFTRAIAEQLDPPISVDLPAWDEQRFWQSRILVVVGSLHPMSRLQARRLLHEAGVKPIVLGHGDTWDTPSAIQAVLDRFEAEEKLYVLMTPEERNMAEKSDLVKALSMMISIREDRSASGIKRRSLPPQIEGYVIAGGHTAQAVCSSLGGRELQILGESEPGIVRAILDNALPIILKAGGFGDEMTLARCVGLE